MKLLIAGLAVLALAGCGGGGGNEIGPDSCSDTPRINSSPMRTATVGQQYGYEVDWVRCFLCFKIEPGRLPPGAIVVGSGVYWTPEANYTNRDVAFSIRTPSNACGNSDAQSWTVHVYAAPRIDAFTPTRQAVMPGERTTLTASFLGSGYVAGIGPILSGQTVTTPPLTTSSSFSLVVTNPAGAQIRRIVSIAVVGPPVVQTLSASPAVIGIGASSTLTWTTSGDISVARMEPSGVDVTNAATLVVTPAATTTYVLHLTNALGESTSASVQVDVIPSAAIESFTATPASVGPNGITELTARFVGTGTIEKELNGQFFPLGPINSGERISSGTLMRSTGFRLTVRNALGVGTTKDLLVPLTGPGTFAPTTGQPIDNRFYSTATRLHDGRVFIAGGSKTEIFDPANETFTAGPNLINARTRHGAALLPDGRVLLVGGILHSDQTAEIYDPRTNSISAVSNFPSRRTWPPEPRTLVLQDGRVLVVTAIGEASEYDFGVVVFDPVTETFGPLIRFANPYYGGGNVAILLLPDGRALFANGSTAEIFTPGPDSFQLVGSQMSIRGVDFATALLPGGRILFTGGTLDATTRAEILDPTSGLVTTAGSQQFSRRSGTATSLASGAVLLVGGSVPGANPGEPWAELFNPSTQSFSATGGLRTGRQSHTATLLLDGRVLVYGGCSSVPCEAEIYTPPQ